MNLLTQQTKELVRRKTEILVHGSEVEQEKEEDHHKNWTLRRMQTRGTCSSIAGSNLTNNKKFLFLISSQHLKKPIKKRLLMVRFEPMIMNSNIKRKIGVVGNGKC